MAAASNPTATMEQRITYITPGDQQRQNHTLIRRPGTGSPTAPLILQPNFDYYATRYLIDPTDFEACYEEVKSAVVFDGLKTVGRGKVPATKGTKLKGKDPTPVSATKDQVTGGSFKPKQKWTEDDRKKGLCTAGDVFRSRHEHDLQQEQEKIYNEKTGRDGKGGVAATNDIYMLPCRLYGVVYRPGDNNKDDQMKTAIDNGTFPLSGANLLLHRAPATLAFLGMLEQLFALDTSSNPPTWKYNAFCSMVSWMVERGDTKTRHAGVLYGGVLRGHGKSATSGFKVIYIETHPRDPGCENELPLSVIAIGQMLGVSQIIRMFGNQEYEPNCAAFALKTFENIVIGNSRPNLSNQHQVVPLRPARPAADTGAFTLTSSLQLVLPDWLRE